MSQSNFSPAVEKYFPFCSKHEGGYANISGDHGGPTNRGVTLDTYNNLKDQLGITNSLKQLNDNDLKTFIQWFFDHNHLALINSLAVQVFMLDVIWGSGSGDVTMLQKVVNVVPDGVIGYNTSNAVNSQNSISLLAKLFISREQQFRKYATKDVQSKFLTGWLRRLYDLNVLVLSLKEVPGVSLATISILFLASLLILHRGYHSLIS